MERKVYISDGEVCLSEYISEIDDLDFYNCWLDEETQKGYNYIRDDSFDVFKSKPIRNRFIQYFPYTSLLFGFMEPLSFNLNLPYLSYPIIPVEVFTTISHRLFDIKLDIWFITIITVLSPYLLLLFCIRRPKKKLVADIYNP